MIPVISKGSRLGWAIAEVLSRLEAEHGPRPWEIQADPLSTLIIGVLSQNTSDRNSRPAFDKLKARFPSWEELARSQVGEIAQAIRSGGLAQIKAQRIKLVLQQILIDRGSLDLNFLLSLPVEEARAWLRGLPGVGPKTAAVVLLFSVGQPVLPVDTHVHRVSRCLGLIGSRVSREKAHQLLQEQLLPHQVYPFHVLLLEHGRRTCRARNPLCHRCVLAQGCPYYLGGGK